jgi:signal transduction histidine kinase/CheY-like chemotaxis protein/ligand-binding sensor domain-containing protein
VSGHEDSVRLEAIASGPDGRLYVGLGNGLAIRVPSAQGRFQFIPAEPIRGIHVDPSGVVWMWCGSQICTLNQSGQIDFASPILDAAGSRGGGTLTDKNGSVWARSSRGIFVKHSGDTKFISGGTIPPSDDFGTMTLDRDGALLVPTDEGLYRFDGAQWRPLTTTPTMTAIEDREGSLWVARSGGGLARWAAYRSWTSFAGAAGPGNNNVWGLARDAQGIFWVGTDTGVHTLDESGPQPKWKNWPVVKDRVQAIRAAPDGAVWVATGSTLLRIHGPSNSVKHFGGTEGLDGAGITQAMFDGAHHLWLSTHRGLFRSNPNPGFDAKFESVTLPGEPSDIAYDIFLLDHAGVFWIGGPRGLFRVTGDSVRRFSEYEGLKPDRVARLAQTPDGSIWIGYRDALGLTRLRVSVKGSPAVAHFTTENGLHSNQPITLGTDELGRLWYGTDNGVEVLEGDTWTRLSQAGGLVWDDVNGNAFFSEPGAVWIGTSQGLSRFRLEQGSGFARTPPRVVIASIVAGRQMNDGRAPIRFPYDSGALIIDYAALTFANESSVQFRYRLKGAERDWNRTSAREARYAGLSPGTYWFEVQARVDQGGWSELATSPTITVVPPWWRSWLFYIVLAAAIGFIVWRLWRVRMRRMLVAQKRLELTVMARTAEIERLLENARRATSFKSQFLAHMSHEIRTPMNGVLGLTEVMLDDDPSPEQRANLELVKSSADSLLSIINDILDLSKVEAGKIELEPISFSLREQIADLLRLAEVRAQQRNITLRYIITPDVPNELVGDPYRLRQILMNLVGNAIKFSENSDVVITILLNRQDASGVELEFCVKDSGIGIPIEDQARVFEAFQQADGSVTRRFGGTGLGLSIARRLTELMGGKMWLDSEPGRGSSFYFTACFDRTPAQDALVHPNGNGTYAIQSGQNTFQILVAEDNAVNQRVITSLLRRRGHMVTLASDGAQAVELCNAHRFDIVLMDLHMPGMDGLDATRAIRAHEHARANGRVRIIALTADDFAGDRDKCLKAGMDGYLSKPVDSSELFRVIEQQDQPC